MATKVMLKIKRSELVTNNLTPKPMIIIEKKPSKAWIKFFLHITKSMYFPLSLTTRKLYKTIKNSEAIVAAAAPFCLNTGIKEDLFRYSQ